MKNYDAKLTVFRHSRPRLREDRLQRESRIKLDPRLRGDDTGVPFLHF